MRQNPWMRLILGLVLGIGLMILSELGIAQEKDSVNLLLNPGFEADENKDGLPDGWHCRAGISVPELVRVFLDTKQIHDGKYSLCIEHKGGEAYSSVSTGVQVKPHTDYIARCWVRSENIGAKLPKAAGVRLLILKKGGRMTPSADMSFRAVNRWVLTLVRFNTGDHKAVSVMVYLHHTAGTVWFDDVEVFPASEAKAKEAESGDDAKEKEAVEAKQELVFPKVYLYPGTVANERRLNLLKGEPQYLVFNYKMSGVTTGVKLILNIPPELRIIDDFIFTPNEFKKYLSTDSSGVRYSAPLSAEFLDKTRRRISQFIVLEGVKVAEFPVTLRWHLEKDGKNGPSGNVRVRVWPELTPLQKMPVHFRVLSGRQTTLSRVPADKERDVLFRRLLDLYIKAGLPSGGIETLGSTAKRRALIRQIVPDWSRQMWSGFGTSFAMRSFDGDTRRKLELLPAIDSDGKPYANFTPSLTQLQLHDAGGCVARWYMRYFNNWPDLVKTLDEHDIWFFDYEPHHPALWGRGSFDQATLDAFAKFSGIARDKLTPESILTNFSKQWTDFYNWEHIQIIKQTRDALQGQYAKAKFALCSNAGRYFRKELLNEMDIYAPMIYDRHPMIFLPFVEQQRHWTDKPYMPVIDLSMNTGGTEDGSRWTSPEEVKLKIVSAALAGASGILLWPGMQMCDGLDFLKVRQALNIIGRYEDFFLSGEHVDNLVTVNPVSGSSFVASRGRCIGQEHLIILFNFHSNKPAKTAICFSGITKGKWYLWDPMENMEFSVPRKGGSVWNAENLKMGLELEIPANEIRILMITPKRPSGLKVVSQADAPKLSAGETERGPLKIPFFTTSTVSSSELVSSFSRQKSVFVSGFSVGEKPAKADTVAYLSADEQYFYISLSCQEPRMNILRSERHEPDNASVCGDDCIEVFLRPAAGMDDVYYHLIINAIGTIYDDRTKAGSVDVSWDSGVVVKPYRDAKSWNLDLAIPWKNIRSRQPVAGEVWGLNLCRERKGVKDTEKVTENSSWENMFGAFIPPTFANVTFSATAAGNSQ